MKTPLEQALELARSGCADPQTPARLTARQALGLWLRLYATTFFGMLVCAITASIGVPLLALRNWPGAEPATILFSALALCLAHCLGNLLLLQGIAGARWLQGGLFATLFLGGLLGWLQTQTHGLGGLATGAASLGLLLVLSARYRALQALHRVIRELRRQY